MRVCMRVFLCVCICCFFYTLNVLSHVCYYTMRKNVYAKYFKKYKKYEVYFYIPKCIYIYKNTENMENKKRVFTFFYIQTLHIYIFYFIIKTFFIFLNIQLFFLIIKPFFYIFFVLGSICILHKPTFISLIFKTLQIYLVFIVILK